jgi:hypothetical protein
VAQVPETLEVFADMDVDMATVSVGENSPFKFGTFHHLLLKLYHLSKLSLDGAMVNSPST